LPLIIKQCCLCKYPWGANFDKYLIPVSFSSSVEIGTRLVCHLFQYPIFNSSIQEKAALHKNNTITGPAGTTVGPKHASWFEHECATKRFVQNFQTVDILETLCQHFFLEYIKSVMISQSIKEIKYRDKIEHISSSCSYLTYSTFQNQSANFREKSFL